MPNQVRTWEENYAQLVAYKKERGDCMVPLRYAQDKILGKWVSTQRESRYVLKPERKELLDSIGFEWHPRQRRSDDKWNGMFKRLLEYREKNDLATVFSANKEDPELVKWCCNQREYSGRGLLNEERYNRLRDVGFPVRPLQKSVQAKREQDQQQIAPPEGNISNASTDSNQKAKKKKIKKMNLSPAVLDVNKTAATKISRFLTEENEQDEEDATTTPPTPSPAPTIVPSADLIATTSGSGTARRRSWLESYAALAGFKGQHGHCRVPIQYKQDKQLGIWVGEQKKKKFLMSDERREKLEELGFTWANPRGKQWSVMFEKLREYREEHPQNFKPKNFNLRKWLESQRHAILDGSLSRECADKLRSIGYDFSDEIKTLDSQDSMTESEGGEGEEEDSSIEAISSTEDSQSIMPPKKKRQVSVLSEPGTAPDAVAEDTPMGDVAESLLSLSAPGGSKPPSRKNSDDATKSTPPKKKQKTSPSLIEHQFLPPPPPELPVVPPTEDKAADTAKRQHYNTRGVGLFMGTDAAASMARGGMSSSAHGGALAANNVLPVEQMLALQQGRATGRMGINNANINNASAMMTQQLQQQHPWQQHRGPQQPVHPPPPTKSELDDLQLADLYLLLVKEIGPHRR